MLNKRTFAVLLLCLTVVVSGCFGLANRDKEPQLATVRGTVENASGDPVAGATVTLGTVVATTQANGSYTFTDIAYGTYTLAVIVEVDGHDVVVEYVAIDVNEPEVVQDFTIPDTIATQQVSGTAVWDDGPALTGAVVSIAGLEHTIDYTGEFIFEHVLEGEHTLKVTQDGNVLYEENVTVEGAGVVRDIVLEFPRTQLRNGDFELWPVGFDEADALVRTPYGWVGSNYQLQTIADIGLTKERSYTGDYALKVQIDETAGGFFISSRPFEVTPGKEYVASAWVYNESEGYEHKIHLYFEFWPEDGWWGLDADYWSVDSWENATSGKHTPDRRVAVTWKSAASFDEWEQVVTNPFVAPENAKYATIGFWTHRDTLKSFIDKVELIVVD